MTLLAGSSPRTWGTPAALPAAGPTRRFIPTHMGNALLGGGLLRLIPVHPHAHGERRRRTVRRADPPGSSPRTWGTHDAVGGYRLRARFIPTHMGNAARRGRVNRRPPVHPHAHGERRGQLLDKSRGVGSSPRTWGTQRQPGHAQHVARFIPTHMGNAGRRRWC